MNAAYSVVNPKTGGTFDPRWFPVVDRICKLCIDATGWEMHKERLSQELAIGEYVFHLTDISHEKTLCWRWPITKIEASSRSAAA